jgi:putative NIF3 family GTP cyclohydrolase 1 type 2
MYAVTSAGSDRHTALADFKDMIRAVRQEARRHNWTEIISNRIAPNGTERIMRVKINSQQHGANRMAKEKIAPVSEIFTGGKLNHGQMMKGFNHALKQISDGHYAIENGTATQTEVSPGRVHISIEFDRIEK